jgi:MFS family permease
VVTTALPAIGLALHARLSDLEWTVNAYTLVFTIGMIPVTTVGVRLGHRRNDSDCDRANLSYLLTLPQGKTV